MLVLGHAGITLGAATLLAGALQVRRLHKIRDGLTKAVPVLERSSGEKVSWFAYLGRCVDIRLLLVGSLLPDIIDKPVGQLFFRETFSQGRIFSHTLLFLVIITVAGYYLYKRRRAVWLLTLSFGTFLHLILDQIWNAPRTLFWPFGGATFAREDLTSWASNIFQAIMSNPGVYVPEAVGLVILLWFGLALVRRKKVGAFIKCGKAY